VWKLIYLRMSEIRGNYWTNTVVLQVNVILCSTFHYPFKRRFLVRWTDPSTVLLQGRYGGSDYMVSMVVRIRD
jgi:hypothetical protein